MPEAPDTATSDAGAVARVRDIAAGSGSSFYWAMRLLPRARRGAMFAIYAFCRDVDDIADGDLPAGEQRLALQGWREEIGRLWDGSPESPIGRALLDAKTRYRLNRADLEAIIDGVEMDAAWSARPPDRATLELYCSRVAGAVGLLSIKVFGDDSPDARRGALALGYALQFTNILRDLAEDAARGRLYLPRELLDRFGVPPGDPVSVIGYREIARVCDTLADAAGKRFDEAEQAFANCDRKAMRPARAMMAVYRLLLRRLRERGWTRLAERPRIARPTKLWLALRHGLF